MEVLKKVRPLEVPSVDFTGNRETFYRDIVRSVNLPGKGKLQDILNYELINIKEKIRERGLGDLLEQQSPYYYTKINHGLWNEMLYAIGAHGNPEGMFEKRCARFYQNKKEDKSLAISGYSKYIASGFAVKLKNIIQDASKKHPDKFWFGLGLDNGIKNISDQLKDIEVLSKRETLSGVGVLTSLSFILAAQFLREVPSICSANLPRMSIVDDVFHARLAELVLDSGVVVVGPAMTLERLGDARVGKVEIPPANGYAQDVYYNVEVYAREITDRIQDSLAGRAGFAVVEAGPLATYLAAYCCVKDVNVRFLDFGLAAVTLFDRNTLKGKWMNEDRGLRGNILR